MDVVKRWALYDRYGNEVYLSEERWAHITKHHPEMGAHERELRETVHAGRRRQDSLQQQKYYYSKAFSGLADGNTHVVAIVLFGGSSSQSRGTAANNYVVTAYLKTIG
jgi:hypothetical protein